MAARLPRNLVRTGEARVGSSRYGPTFFAAVGQPPTVDFVPSKAAFAVVRGNWSTPWDFLRPGSTGKMRKICNPRAYKKGVWVTPKQ